MIMHRALNIRPCSEWNERGGSSAVDAGTAAHESLMLCLPPPASGLNLPSYDLEAAPPELSLSTSHIRPLLDLREENPLRVSSLQPNGSCGMFMVSGESCAHHLGYISSCLLESELTTLLLHPAIPVPQSSRSTIPCRRVFLSQQRMTGQRTCAKTT